ncbi:uncharacterized protein METZ01_LOCUS128920 [marine metagenome]|uniref:Uncharacterized protein n=1 Tax=marine metagenome TaxID=408172 RepID=A0A381YG13_9ZZZZ
MENGRTISGIEEVRLWNVGLEQCVALVVQRVAQAQRVDQDQQPNLGSLDLRPQS